MTSGGCKSKRANDQEKNKIFKHWSNDSSDRESEDTWDTRFGSECEMSCIVQCEASPVYNTSVLENRSFGMIHRYIVLRCESIECDNGLKCVRMDVSGQKHIGLDILQILKCSRECFSTAH
jgi:hypothetical protein